MAAWRVTPAHREVRTSATERRYRGLRCLVVAKAGPKPSDSHLPAVVKTGKLQAMQAQIGQRFKDGQS